MNKKFFFVIFILFSFSLTSCSLDNKTGIWKGIEAEKRRAIRIQRQQNTDVTTAYSSEKIIILEEILPKKKIIIEQPIKNNSWLMTNLNYQNNTGNLFISGIDNTFLKKKVGKNKFKISKVTSSPVITKDYIILADDRGTIFKLNKLGKIKWKKNIYKKLYKKLYKNLSFTINENLIYVSDNLGFVYAINFNNGELVWIKNQEVPLKSIIKVYNNKIFVVNENNKIICLDKSNGNKIWDFRSIPSFIKLQNFLSLAISKNGDLVTLNSTGNLIKIKSNNGRLYWSFNAISSKFAHDNDFFKSSQIVIGDGDVFFFASDRIYSFNLNNGSLNWEHEIVSQNTPILNGNNVFLLSNSGFFLNLDKKSGTINWSINVLKILKDKHQNTEVTGVVMGSGKLYVTTKNGFLIECSASSGKAISFKKIGDPISVPPVISNGSLYILTEKSKIFGFN